jgi:UDPglucose--hexose-1-phosphate uridylyltransferase
MPTTAIGEMRQNLLTDRWVIFAPGRADRPSETQRDAPRATALPEKDGHCPFCIGNEHMLPRVLFEQPSRDGELWQTRIVPNKYPMLSASEDVTGANRGLYRVASGFGYHEVLIETPYHNRDIPFMGPEEVLAVVEAYVRRYSDLWTSDQRIESIVVFRNHGSRAGTSLRHPHSQIVATGLVPGEVVHRERVALDYHQRMERCALCDVVEFEQTERVRVVHENKSFLSFVPFAAEAAFETWIAPKRHCADFGLIAEQEVVHLAEALQDALQRFHDRLEDPDYNYVIHSCSKQESFVPHLHWFLQVRPRISTPAGFELGSGMSVNHSLPERDAEMLRGM